MHAKARKGLANGTMNSLRYNHGIVYMKLFLPFSKSAPN